MAHRIEIGAQVGGHVTDGGVEQGRVGAQVAIGLASVFEFYPAFNRFVQRWSGSAIPASGWQALVALRVRPFGVEALVGVEAVPPFCVVHAVRSYSRADGDPGILRTEGNKSEARFGIYPRGIKDVISR